MKKTWRAILFLVFAGSTAVAQPNGFDLETLPAGYSFESAGMTGNITMTYLRKENGVYFFESRYKPLLRNERVTNVRLNRQSQTLSFESPLSVSVYAPHDCGPSLGTCTYSSLQDGDFFQLKTETTVDGDIWTKDKYVMRNGEWAHYFRSCNTYDQYGFWLDSVTFIDGLEDDWDFRKYPALTEHHDDRLERLRRACAPPGFTS